MTDITSASEGDEVAVVEGEDVVVEGVVMSVTPGDEGVRVVIREGESSVLEYWENVEGRVQTSLARRRDSRRLKPIPVLDTSSLLVK